MENPDSDIWLLRRLYKACVNGDVSEIDGVHFDLRHEDLDRAQWKPGALLGQPGEPRGSTPDIIFPWQRTLKKRSARAQGNSTIVGVGDTVRIDRVVRAPIRSDFGRLDHPHHLERRVASVVIERASGERIIAQGTWQFSGVEDVLRPIRRGDYRQVQRVLFNRLAGILGVADVYDIFHAGSQGERPVFPATASEMDRLAVEAAWVAETETMEGAAMAFGYLMGRAEANHYLFPLAAQKADHVEKLRENASGTRSSGDPSRDTAIKFIEAEPDIRFGKCARLVGEALGHGDLRGPRTTIRPLFHKVGDGSLRPNMQAVDVAKKKIAERSALKKSPNLAQ